jgi:hypothetical protein
VRAIQQKNNQRRTPRGSPLSTSIFIKELDLTNHLLELKMLEGNIKEMNQLKREQSQRIEEMMAKEMQEEREKKQSE